jgi:branched-chain amino acid transport system ATP-binding protein
LEVNDPEMLKVEDLSVFHGHIRALTGISLSVLGGELVALIGANGAGKSTFLESVLGLHKAQTGRIHFQGQEITNLPTDRIVAGGIVLCPEGRGILPEMSVLENLLLGAYHNRKTAQSRLEAVFEYFPVLKGYQKLKAGSLSGGQQQMLSIGRSLMASPRLLMMDEPSLGLAPIVVNELFRTIQALASEGHTILLSEQNAKKSLQYAQRAYVFETGTIALEGLSQDLMRNENVLHAYLGGKKNANA